MTDTTEAAVIDEVLAGNCDNYRYLVERYHRGLVQHIYNLTHDQASAEDIAQEAFIRAFDKLSQYNTDFAFSTWLYKIAHNIAFNQHRTRRPVDDIAELETSLADDSPSLAEVTDREFSRQAVRQAITALPEAYRQVIILYYWDNFNYEEIASIMERPVGTIRTWLHRAKQQLRKEQYGQV